MVDIIVAVPAHNEQDTIGACIAAVWASVRVAIASGLLDRAIVAVSAHRCRDRTESIARAALIAGAAGSAATSWRLDTDLTSATVGEVRAALVAGAAADLPADADSWLFNTDADSLVPTGWIAELLEAAEARSATAVAGLVTLSGWTASEAARQRYRDLINAGLTSTGHRHVYGANLAVRWDVYRAVGGFHGVPHGEDTQLMNRIRSAGHPVASVFHPVVTTSGRVPGRAADGLGDLLGTLASDDETADV